MPEFEQRNGFFSAVTDRIQKLINKRQKVEVSASMATFVEPHLSVLPNPSEDPDGYARYFILREEKDAFYGGNDILRPSDLDHEVMEWIRTYYPNSFSTPGIRLHFMKSSWLRDRDQRLNNPDGWKELLKNDGWKEFANPSDFNK